MSNPATFAKHAHPRIRRDIPPLLWLGLPLLILLVLWLSPMLGYERWRIVILGERIGFIENLTVLFLIVATVMSLRMALRRTVLPRSVRILLVLLALGSLFLAGEEASWGQHWIRYETPSDIADDNIQGEFNLHNRKGFWQECVTSHGRHAAGWGVVALGIVFPLALLPWRDRIQSRSAILYWLAPSWRVVPAALLSALAKVPAHMMTRLVGEAPRKSYAWMALYRPGGELKEFGLALLVLLYVLSLDIRVRQHSEP